MSQIFADANSGYQEAEIVLAGVPFDNTSCFRKGSRHAPDAIRKATYNFETYNRFFDIDLLDLRIHDFGNVAVTDDVDSTLDILLSVANGIVSDGKLPVIIGGEHSVTYSCVKACAQTYTDFGVVVLDAHLDLRPEYEGLRNSHACVSRHIIEDVTENYVSIGIRSGTKEEYDFVVDNEILCFSSDDVLDTGIEEVIDEAVDYLDCEHIYLSIDADAIDPAYAPALGTPEPYGLTPRDVRAVIAAAAPFVVGFDLVEIAPEYDSGNTALLGGKLIRDFMAAYGKSL